MNHLPPSLLRRLAELCQEPEAEFLAPPLLSNISVLTAYGQDRNLRTPDYPLGGTADDNTLHTGATVCAHDDQVGIDLAGGLKNLLKCCANHCMSGCAQS